jgi:hypothetical protein
VSYVRYVGLMWIRVDYQFFSESNHLIGQRSCCLSKGGRFVSGGVFELAAGFGGVAVVDGLEVHQLYYCFGSQYYDSASSSESNRLWTSSQRYSFDWSKDGSWPFGPPFSGHKDDLTEALHVNYIRLLYLVKDLSIRGFPADQMLMLPYVMLGLTGDNDSDGDIEIDDDEGGNRSGQRPLHARQRTSGTMSTVLWIESYRFLVSTLACILGLTSLSKFAVSNALSLGRILSKNRTAVKMFAVNC